MFTGLIEEIGVIERIVPRGKTTNLVIKASKVLEDVSTGDSIAVSGACLTVTEFNAATFTVQAVAETLKRTTLSGLSTGARVNLERSLSLGDRLGGHLVQGHIDGAGTVTAVRGDADNTEFTIAHPPELGRYIAEKGSIAVDGISLTIATVGSGTFKVSVIAHTLAATTLAHMRTGDRVNLETDVIAKYVERLMGSGGDVSLERLTAEGF